MIQINARAEAAHNYVRAHRQSLWSEPAIGARDGIERAARAIEAGAGRIVLQFPMQREFFVDFGVAA